MVILIKDDNAIIINTVLLLYKSYIKTNNPDKTIIHYLLIFENY